MNKPKYSTRPLLPESTHPESYYMAYRTKVVKKPKSFKDSKKSKK